MTRRLWGLGLAAGLVGLAGCGGESSADLAGTVTYKGKPVTSGTVSVVQRDGLSAAGAIGPDGRYAVTGAVAGPGKVGVHSPDPRETADAGRRDRAADMAATAKFDPRESAAKDKARAKGAGDSTWRKLPDKYFDPEKSGLSYVLKPGANTLDIVLTD